MHCIGCGAEIKKGQKFCPACGMEMGSSADSPKVENIPKITTSPRVVKTITTSPRRTGRKIFVIFLIITIVGSGIFGVVTMMNWGLSEGSADYYYENASPSSVEALRFNVGTSDIIINYTTSPSAPVAEIHLDYYVAGGFVNDKAFDEIYYLNWDNTSGVKSFFLYIKPFAGWVMIQNTNIYVTLRSDVTYEITVEVSTGDIILNIPDDAIVDKVALTGSTGSIEMNAGSNVAFQDTLTATTSTGDVGIIAEDSTFSSDIFATTSTGNVDFNFNNCTFNGDFNVLLSTGHFSLDLYNPQYQSDQIWDISTSTGSINIDIYQYLPMLNDITADFQTSTGDISIDYNGNDTVVGARFVSSISTGNYYYDNLGGFLKSNSLFESLGYDSALSKYTFTLGVSTGNIYVAGESQ